MEQESLFHEDIFDALKTCIQALKGNKKVGSALWPDKPVGKAGEMLADCLNRDRAQKLDPEQVLWILREARKAGCNAGMFFIADACDYKRPEPIVTEEKEAELLERVEQVGEVFNQLLTEVKRLSDG